MTFSLVIFTYKHFWREKSNRMYFTWNFLAQIFVIYYHAKFMWLLFPCYHTISKIAVQAICLYHILMAGNLTGFVRPSSLLPQDFVFLGSGSWCFKNTSCFASEFDIWQSINVIYWFIGTGFQRIHLLPSFREDYYLNIKIYRKALIISGYSSLVET